MKTLGRVWIIAILLFAIAGCEQLGLGAKPKKKEVVQGPPPGITVVAKVGNFYISVEELNKDVEDFNKLVAQQGVSQNKLDTRDKKIAYLRNDLVRRYILYQEALDRGMERRDDIAKALENARMGLLVSELLREEIEKVDVSGKEIEDFYNQNKELLKEPEQRRILEIMTPSEEEAKQVNIEILKGGDFAGLAKQYSKAPTATKGGDLGFIALDMDAKKRVRFDKFYEVAFAPTLEPGNISSIFKGPDGYYLIKLEGIKKSEAKSLSELRENIKSWLLFEKQQKAIADLASKISGQTKIEIFEGKVE